jgi:hypothetical protein
VHVLVHRYQKQRQQCQPKVAAKNTISKAKLGAADMTENSAIVKSQIRIVSHEKSRKPVNQVPK